MRSKCPITARLVLLQEAEEEEEGWGRSGRGGEGRSGVLVAENEPRCATETS